MEYVMFFLTAAIALIGGIGMLLDRNAVHSALFLLLNFLAIAVLFVLLRAFFLAMIQALVYAGAIMVLFVFVVMLLGSERVEDRRNKILWQHWIALALSLVLIVQTIIISSQVATNVPLEETTELTAISQPERVGEALFTTYLLPFEITGVLLLVAIVGVVVLQQRSRETSKPEQEQVSEALPDAESTGGMG
jgi:NADH-quinone oxidoreductase subunit J